MPNNDSPSGYFVLKSIAQWVQDTFAYTCRDLSLFDVALTHRSMGGQHNERLEFLGDAILNSVTATLLYRAFPVAPEGELSRYRATLVSGDSLGSIAADFQVGEYLKLGQGELKSGGFRRKSTLADAFEAIIGAIYLDSDFDQTSTVIERIFAGRIKHLPLAAQLKDPKTRLQEALQARSVNIPEYQVEAITGEPHQQHFQVSCKVAVLNLYASGAGTSRRGAEQAAAELVLTQLQTLWSKAK